MNGSKFDYEMMQAVTDPRMVSPYFHDVRLERTYVHHKEGFELLASETPERLTMSLNRWLANRYRASYTWPVEQERVAKQSDGITGSLMEVRGQRSNQLNYVPNRGINDLA